MCGIAGIWGESTTREALASITERMTVTLSHRGPDAQGVWIDPAVGIGLGHRRLAILDLSADGNQPMISPCGRYILIFNGEIYNFLELRTELEGAGISFRGYSDTEVMLASFAAWGVKGAVQRFNGMFAFALWSRAESRLYLGRDRLGKKPLYYSRAGGRLLFGSELKALRPAGGWHSGIDATAASAFFCYGFVPGEASILRGVRKLLPGHLLALSSPADPSEPEAYWSVEGVIATTAKESFRGTHQDAEDELKGLLVDAVRIRLRADVPLGAFLSGGIDSSLVVALMQAAGGEPIRTFTIGFEESEYDESSAATQVADALRCQHRSVRLEPSELMEIVPSLPAIYDEPFADVSQVPTLLVSRLARHEVAVCLSGDGGDELFGGYNRHFLTARYWPVIASTPLPLRRAIANCLTRIGYHRLALLSRLLGTVRTPEEKMSKAIAVLGVDNIQGLYEVLLAQNTLQAQGSSSFRNFSPEHLPVELNTARYLMAMDTAMYLPDDILVKTDRASMSVGLELRSPLLDYRVLEFAWRLPERWLVRRGVGKRILRTLLRRQVFFKRGGHPKMGFAVPIGKWLCGPLRSWAEEMMPTHKEDPWLPAGEFRIRWQQHQSRQADHGHWLWRALMWTAWREHWRV